MKKKEHNPKAKKYHVWWRKIDKEWSFLEEMASDCFKSLGWLPPHMRLPDYGTRKAVLEMAMNRAMKNRPSQIEVHNKAGGVLFVKQYPVEKKESIKFEGGGSVGTPPLPKKYRSAAQRGFDELFDEVCLQLAGKYNPRNEAERERQCNLINDVIVITKGICKARVTKSVEEFRKLWSKRYPS